MKKFLQIFRNTGLLTNTNNKEKTFSAKNLKSFVNTTFFSFRLKVVVEIVLHGVESFKAGGGAQSHIASVALGFDKPVLQVRDAPAAVAC